MITSKIFKTKNKANIYNIYKKPNETKNKLITNNSAFKFKHFPPYITEWINSIYCYNKNNIKSLPNLDIKVYNLIKSYFNLYIVKYNNKLKTKRWRIRTKRPTTRKLITSKPNIKHTNDKIIITTYTYDNSSIDYASKITELISLDQIKQKQKYIAFFTHLKRKYFLLERQLRNNLKNKYFKNYLRKIMINKRELYFLKNTKNYENLKSNNIGININKKSNFLFLSFLKKELKTIFTENLNYYIKKLMQDEIISICYKQCINFEQYKYEKQYTLLLTNLLEKIYNKKVVLDIVNLKYFYNSNNIISNSLLTKLIIKKNKIINSLELLLTEFNIPSIDRKKRYDEMYNRKRSKQNIFLKNLGIDNYVTPYKLDNAKFNDTIETCMCENNNIYKDSTNANVHQIIDSLKNKFTKGIRLEVAGRLTKRSTANRSIHKFRYKGNIRNEDSSMKKLPTVLLRGHVKSNLVYIKSRSKLRVGAFGLKTWVSAN